MVHLSLRGLFGLCTSAFLACAGAESNDSTESTASGPPQIELGAGRTSFVPFPDSDATLEIVSGPQGGWHFEHTLLVAGFDPEGALLVYTARDASSGEVLSFPAEYVLRRKGLVEHEDGRLLRVGDRTVLDIPSPVEVEGRTIELRCVASRGGSTLAEDSVRVVATDEVDELR